MGLEVLLSFDVYFFSSPFMFLHSFKFLSSFLEAGVPCACGFVLVWDVFQLKGQGCETPGDVPFEKTDVLNVLDT